MQQQESLQRLQGRPLQERGMSFGTFIVRLLRLPFYEDVRDDLTQGDSGAY